MLVMNAEHINPFLIAAINVLKNTCFVEAKVGKAYIKDTKFTEDTLVIMIGVTGEMKGQVMMAFEDKVACDIASKMCMTQICELDEISSSAICELGNIILGNAATIFSQKGIKVDITPPTMCMGHVSFSNYFTKNICVPVVYDNKKTIEINLAVKASAVS